MGRNTTKDEQDWPVEIESSANWILLFLWWYTLNSSWKHVQRKEKHWTNCPYWLAWKLPLFHTVKDMHHNIHWGFAPHLYEHIFIHVLYVNGELLTQITLTTKMSVEPRVVVMPNLSCLGPIERSEIVHEVNVASITPSMYPCTLTTLPLSLTQTIFTSIAQ